jgi:hypothetical protein
MPHERHRARKTSCAKIPRFKCSRSTYCGRARSRVSRASVRIISRYSATILCDAVVLLSESTVSASTLETLENWPNPGQMPSSARHQGPIGKLDDRGAAVIGATKRSALHSASSRSPIKANEQFRGQPHSWLARPNHVRFHERVRAGEHFPTDVIAGSIAGAGIGLVVPHLHRTEDIKQRRNALSRGPWRRARKHSRHSPDDPCSSRASSLRRLAPPRDHIDSRVAGTGRLADWAREFD